MPSSIAGTKHPFEMNPWGANISCEEGSTGDTSSTEGVVQQNKRFDLQGSIPRATGHQVDRRKVS
jgi:secreted PhoX family phosphatase